MRWLTKSGRTRIAWDIRARLTRFGRRRVLIFNILLWIALAILYGTMMVVYNAQRSARQHEIDLTVSVVLATNNAPNVTWGLLWPSLTPEHWPSWTPTPSPRSKPKSH